MIDGLYKIMDIMHIHRLYNFIKGIEPGNSTTINDIIAVVIQVKFVNFTNLIHQQYSPATFDAFF